MYLLLKVLGMFFLLGNSLIDTGFTGFQFFSTHQNFQSFGNFLKADPDDLNVGGHRRHFTGDAACFTG